MSGKREALRSHLQRLEGEAFRLQDNENCRDYLPEMLEYIGDPESVFREWIYAAFYTWLYQEDLLSPSEMRELLAVLLDERHLFYGIGEKEGESVFTRTFSILPVSLIIARHRQTPFLPQEEFTGLQAAILRYYREERDLRGYVDTLGWAHAAAHGADALDELARCPESGEAFRREVLKEVQRMLDNGSRIFNDEEDERMATVVDSMIRGSLLPEEELLRWIAGLAAYADRPRSRLQSIARQNSKQLVWCLCFRRPPESRSRALNAALGEAQNKLNRYIAQS